MKKLEEYVRSIPDFPEPGIIFSPYRQKADELKALVNRKFFNPETFLCLH